MQRTRRIILVCTYILTEWADQKDGLMIEVCVDDNHKPEMTIAITPFEGLCGFRPLNELSHFLASVPSLSNLVDEDNAKAFTITVSGHEDDTSPEQVEKNKKALQKVFTALMTSEATSVASAAKELVTSAEKDGERFAGGGGPSNTGKELAELVVRLNGQFEGDIGLFVLFFCNYVKLEVGEAMFLKADDIHAYLSGGKSHSNFTAEINVSSHLYRLSFGTRQRISAPFSLHPSVPTNPHQFPLA